MYIFDHLRVEIREMFHFSTWNWNEYWFIQPYISVVDILSENVFSCSPEVKKRWIIDELNGKHENFYNKLYYNCSETFVSKYSLSLTNCFFLKPALLDEKKPLD